MSLALGFIVEQLGGILHGSPDTVITGLAPLATAGSGDLSFLSHPRYISQLSSSQAACIIVGQAHATNAIERGCCLVVDNPYLYWAKLTQLWRQHALPVKASLLIHPSAVVSQTAVIHPTARIGPLCVVEDGVSIGAGSWLKSRVTVSAGCVIGENCILHAGVVIGADGFGFALDQGEWIKIEQFGGVLIGNDVEIGANTCVDRGAIEDTVIEDGVKLDNLIQIGHNVHIGKHTAMAGCVGVAGSAKIGAHCTVGGGAVILGHLELADNVHVSAASVVSHSLLKPGTYSGVFPIDENAAWQKNAASLRQLNALRERIRRLENNFNTSGS
ncbi:MAG: UDP-3-O-(3-hydroxymyristoyl)glucosamine N-acyltransferase [Betaproteobacteria bacterium]